MKPTLPFFALTAVALSAAGLGVAAAPFAQLPGAAALSHSVTQPILVDDDDHYGGDDDDDHYRRGDDDDDHGTRGHDDDCDDDNEDDDDCLRGNTRSAPLQAPDNGLFTPGSKPSVKVN